MSELTFKTIHVDSVADNGKKLTLLDGKEKYGFWKNKQDGSETKAYSQYKSMRVEAGQDYPIAVKEEAKSFTNDQGKLINYTERNLMYFATKEAGEGHVTARVEQTSSFDAKTIGELQVQIGELNLVIGNFRTWAAKTEGEIESLKALVSLVAGKDATDLHTSIPTKAEFTWPTKIATEHQGDNMSPSN